MNLLHDDDFSFLFPRTIFSEFFSQPIKSKGFPVYDIFNENDKTVLEYALAGCSSDQISVCVKGTKLEVKADTTKGKSRVGRRIVDKKFHHSFEAKGLDLDNVFVSFVDGLLRIEIPGLKEDKPEVKEFPIVTDKKLLK